MSKLLTTREVAERLRLNQQTVRSLALKGSLAGHKVGRQWRFPMKAIEKLEKNGDQDE